MRKIEVSRRAVPETVHAAAFFGYFTALAGVTAFLEALTGDGAAGLFGGLFAAGLVVALAAAALHLGLRAGRWAWVAVCVLASVASAVFCFHEVFLTDDSATPWQRIVLPGLALLTWPVMATMTFSPLAERYFGGEAPPRAEPAPVSGPRPTGVLFAAALLVVFAVAGVLVSVDQGLATLPGALALAVVELALARGLLLARDWARGPALVLIVLAFVGLGVAAFALDATNLTFSDASLYELYFGLIATIGAGLGLASTPASEWFNG